jgi:DNA-directed RNA polymerase subunit RPC12/RpoP
MDDKPTKITPSDIYNFVKTLMESEIKPKNCFTCSKEFYFQSYGDAFRECDECFFKRIPKEEREAFFRSFFE